MVAHTLSALPFVSLGSFRESYKDLELNSIIIGSTSIERMMVMEF